MRWERGGLIFKPDGRYPWMLHHASMPTADRISDRVVRIYYAPRNADGLSVTSFIEVDADEPTRVLYVHDRPVLAMGARGCFDDSGVMPSALVDHGGRKYLYYVGWNQGVTVPYRNSIGLAASDDNGITFERVFEGPIVDRTKSEPFFVATPIVLVDEGKWQMWYASATGFLEIKGRIEPVYQIKYAESKDGRDWERPNVTCLEYETEGEANARPAVVKEGGKYRMWYCWRGSTDFRTDKAQSYRIGYAESADGVTWNRMDNAVGIERAESGWDSSMMAYPFVYKHRGVRHMLYCGNGFGESGFGYARLVEDDRAGAVTGS